jgi:ABC-type sugar transport system substrate-binding protein
MSHPLKKSPRRGGFALLACLAASSLVVSACGGGDEETAGAGGGGEEIGVSLITKDNSNPFWIAMQEAGKQAASANGVNLTIGAGKADGDEQGQVTHIENAISQGQQGILISPNGPGVDTALKRARDAGLYVVALDTVPNSADAAAITIGTDNFKAGELIGQWTAGTLAGQPATIAMLDLFDDKVVTVDVDRDQGFLTGMGIDVGDKAKIGDEPSTGTYAGGGTYEIVCHEATQGAADGGRTAMENCLSRNPNINVVYTINEPSAQGANEALKAAGKTGVTMTSVDGGCDPGVRLVKEGVIGATSQQYPAKMAELGVKAVADYVNDGTELKPTEGLEIYDAGVALVTDKPVQGVESITSAEAEKVCWGGT